MLAWRRSFFFFNPGTDWTTQMQIKLVPAMLVLLAQCSFVQAGLPEAAEAMRRNDYSTAIREWTPLAHRGDKMAQFYLGSMHLYGKGVPVDDRQAVIWIRKAAEQGVLDAQYFMSVMYSEGRGVARDEAEATSWVRKAAIQGHREPQHNLGVAYEMGLGVRKNMPEALAWYRKAAAQGDAKAQRRIGTSRQ